MDRTGAAIRIVVFVGGDDRGPPRKPQCAHADHLRPEVYLIAMVAADVGKRPMGCMAPLCCSTIERRRADPYLVCPERAANLDTRMPRHT
jgi:hypothetical protein